MPSRLPNSSRSKTVSDLEAFAAGLKRKRYCAVCLLPEREALDDCLRRGVVQRKAAHDWLTQKCGHTKITLPMVCYHVTAQHHLEAANG